MTELRVFEETGLPVVRLRAGPRGGTAVLAQALRVTLPDQPNTFTGDATLSCAWTEPRAWLILGETGALPDSTLPMAIDVSDRYASLRLQGARAWDVLATGTGLDPATLAPGRCAQTLFAEEIVVFVQRLAGAEPDYRLLVEAPFATFLTDWLRPVLAAAEPAAGSGTIPVHAPRRS